MPGSAFLAAALEWAKTKPRAALCFLMGYGRELAEVELDRRKAETATAWATADEKQAHAGQARIKELADGLALLRGADPEEREFLKRMVGRRERGLRALPPARKPRRSKPS